MSTSETLGGFPVADPGGTPADGAQVTFVLANGRWEIAAGSSGGGGAPQMVGNLRRQEIDDLLLGVSTKLGGFALDPNLFPGATFSLSMVATLTDGGGAAPSFTLELYDMGAPGAPTAGVLRAQASFSTTGNAVRTETTLTVQASPGVAANQIWNVERIYEVRGTLNGDVGDLVEIDWAGVLGT